MKKIMAVLGVSLLLISTAFAQSNIIINSFAFVEKAKIENGKEVKVLEKATNVIPGQTVLFKNIVENKNSIPATDIVVNNKIPKEIIFVEALSSDEKNTQFEYSTDGVTFAQSDKLMVKDKTTGQMRLARPEEYEYIRWIYKKAISPKSQIEFNYRGTLK